MRLKVLNVLLNPKRASKVLTPKFFPKCEKRYTTISRWSPTNSCAKIFIFSTQLRICNYINILFWEFCCNRSVCLKKVQKMSVLGLSLFWNLFFDKSKVNFLQHFWYFLNMIWQAVSFLSLENSFIIHIWASFHPVFGHINSSFI